VIRIGKLNSWIASVSLSLSRSWLACTMPIRYICTFDSRASRVSIARAVPTHEPLRYMPCLPRPVMISMRATMNTHIKAALVVVLLVRHSPILTSTPTRSRSLTMARRVPRISIRDSSQSFEHISVLGCLDDMAGRYAESSCRDRDRDHDLRRSKCSLPRA